MEKEEGGEGEVERSSSFGEGSILRILDHTSLNSTTEYAITQARRTVDRRPIKNSNLFFGQEGRRGGDGGNGKITISNQCIELHNYQ